MKALVHLGKIIQIQMDSFEVHPDYQWYDVPDNCTLDWVFSDGVISAPPPLIIPTDEIIAQYQIAIQNALDNKAREKQYDNSLSIVSYANSTNSSWKLEALAFITWRDSVYSYALNILIQVKNGGSQPSLSDFIAALPTMTWPD